MQIEAGKFYRSRDGQKVGPMEPRTGVLSDFVWGLPRGAPEPRLDRRFNLGWRNDGTFHPYTNVTHSLDLIEKLEDPPYPVEDYGLGDMKGDVKGVPEVAFAGEGSPRYAHDRWTKLLADTMIQMQELSAKKGGEYSGDDDRLANFRRNGAALGLPMETVWAVYAGKHWDAIQQFIKDQRNGKERERLEPIAGRVDDLLVYLLLFKAMLDEQGLS